MKNNNLTSTLKSYIVAPLALIGALYSTTPKVRATQIPVVNSVALAEPLTGVAATSTSKLGSSTGSLYTIINDIITGTNTGTIFSGVSDMGSWDNNSYLILASGSVEKKNVSNNASTAGLTLSNAGAISKVFSYNGNDTFAAWNSADNNINLYNFNNLAFNPLPVATVFNAGAGITGLDARVKTTTGVATNLSHLEFFTTNGASFSYLNSAGGQISPSGPFTVGAPGSLTDITYSANGIVTLSVNDSDFQGQLYNVNFSDYDTELVNPGLPPTSTPVADKSSTGLMLGLGLAGLLGYSSSKSRKL